MNYVLGSRASIGGVLGMGAGAAAGGLPVAGAMLWLDASQITGLSDGAAIATWPDMSGNGHDFTQSTSAMRPTYKAGILNGQPVARFDGGDILNNTSIGTKAQPITIFGVAKTGASNIVADVLILSSSGSLTMQISGTNNFELYAGASLKTAATAATSTWYVWTALYSGGSSAQWINGASAASGNAGSTGLSGTTSISRALSGSYWQSDVAEIIIYHGALGTTDRQALESYLGAKYGIALS